ncbi:CfaE/CblD family pilus tip adhesin [Pantoea ananatis]|uniref:CfaE/CblD family pilus tip adhesin n=1 Tax=Pantoea ananas TaxID=553 RepID=UPI0018907BD4|nr:CfaE/CblD family pilus tip adhesin [Pantoea ananatis]
MKNNHSYMALYDALMLFTKALEKIAIAFMLTSSLCYADTIPTNNTSLTMSFDKRGVPNSITIWNALSGGESPANPELLGRNSLVCQSDSDSTNGKCRIKPVWPGYTPGANKSDALQIKKIITLKFCKNGGECKDLKLDAYHIVGSGAFGTSYFAPFFTYPLNRDGT